MRHSSFMAAALLMAATAAMVVSITHAADVDCQNPVVIPLYPLSSGSYPTGTTVVFNGKVYECTVPSYCAMVQYAPGSFAGFMAWNQADICIQRVTPHWMDADALVESNWGACADIANTGACSIGIQTLARTCMNAHGGATLLPSACDADELAETRSCIVAPCFTQWLVSEWNVPRCHTACGSDFVDQTRDVWCQTGYNRVDDDVCVNLVPAIIKPADFQACPRPICDAYSGPLRWVYSPFNPPICQLQCGEASITQIKEAWCYEGLTPVADELCAHLPKDALTNECVAYCHVWTGTWTNTDEWSECVADSPYNAGACAPGKQTRRRTCSNTNCDPSSPAAETTCAMPTCTYEWRYHSDWSACASGNNLDCSLSFKQTRASAGCWNSANVMQADDTLCGPVETEKPCTPEYCKPQIGFTWSAVPGTCLATEVLCTSNIHPGTAVPQWFCVDGGGTQAVNPAVSCGLLPIQAPSTCEGEVALYVPGVAYQAGDQVILATSSGKELYQCKAGANAPFCAIAGYTPGTANGELAWQKLDDCTNPVTTVPTVAAWSLSNYSTYQVDTRVSNGGKVWKCINPTWAHMEPNSAYGYLGWVVV